ncbi:ABC transporter ATP-binding protein [Herbidospora daliensis]|uniref:ABC transporter ATP-binding protein n=1 Tax=Herbidospora daliensis TaxID=295585 RepID=UPI0007805F6B|nr:ABC transporter ATP-binding protein [Herbidospora daliensis]
MPRTPADRLLIETVTANPAWSVVLLLLDLSRSAAALALPALLAAAVDAQTTGGDLGTVGLLAGLVAVLILLDIASLLVSPWHVNTLVLGLRRDLLGHVLRLGVRDRAAFSTGDLTTRLLTNTGEVASVVPLAAGWIGSLLMSGGALVALALIDWRLCVAFAVGAPVVTLIIRFFVGRASPLMTDYMTVQGSIAGRLTEVLTGLRSVRAAGAERREIDRVLTGLPELHRAGRASWALQGRLNLHASLVLPLIQVAVVATAGYTLLAGELTPGQFAAATAYAGMAFGLFNQANAFMALAQARAGARRLAEVLTVGATARGARELPAGPGELTFRGVSVPGGYADLTVPGGAMAAVVGESGAGKSTLLQLAGRLLDPDEGEVLLDGVPLRDLSPPALADAVSWAFERPAYLPGTVADAIGFGSPGGVREAARLARADTFVRRLPAGYDTPCADAPLSGGERQRLGLARALARPARLLILDDAVSSVDSVTELHISHALAAHPATRLVATHRASLAARADLVVWLDGTGVRAVAPHADLLEQADYRGLFGAEREPIHV